MSAPVTLYSAADVADALEVSRAAVSNWAARGVPTPPPDFVTTDGRELWRSLDPWHAWHVARIRDRVERAERAEAARMARTEAARARLAAAEELAARRVGEG